MTDITLLTCQEYLEPGSAPLEQNILLERELLTKALEAKGLTVHCKAWDDPTYDWTQTRAVVFRTIWDYFERYESFAVWLEEVKTKTQLINPYQLIRWNADKHYLADLEKKGIAIVPTVFVDKGSSERIEEVCKSKKWGDVIIKPAIAGAAFYTYKVLAVERPKFENLFKKLVSERDMLVQPFIETIATKGEASLMVFNGIYTHAILKKVKAGDYRVQDDFGGTVHSYTPSEDEIAFAQQCFAACKLMPAYGRADILWDTNGNILLGELEIIEPELWVRNFPESAASFATGIMNTLSR
jgi:hypothetical protein